MADTVGDLVVKLKADASGVDQGIDQAKSKFDGFKSVVQGVAMGAGMAVANFAVQAGQSLLQFGADSISGASDLNETLSKTSVLFGDSASAVTAFADTASTQFGQSKQQALDAAATFATFGSAAGLAGDDLVGFSTGFVGLASDLASFNNTSPEQAIQAIGAALRGESEPLRAYGVLLDDASMRQKALELGIVATTKDALTPQQKVLAAQALIYEQTSAAQGDFARTSDGLANQQRILDAQMANLQATMGEALLPVVLAFTSAANDLAGQVLPPLADFIRNDVVPVFEQIADVISRTVGPAVEFISRTFTSLGNNMKGQADGPMAYLRQWFEQNMPRIQQIVDTVVGALTRFWTQHGEQITATVTELLGWMTRFWDTQMRTILDVVQVLLQMLTGDWEGAGETLRGILGRWRELIGDAFRAITNGIKEIWQSIDWGGIGRAMIEGIANGIRNAGGALLNAARDAAMGLPDTFKQILGINSPSRVAAQQIGAPFAEGIGVGMAGAMDNVQNRMGAALDDLVGYLSGATPAAATGTISVTQNFYGQTEAAAVREASTDGLLLALRQAGVR